jgi:hypothetical protein
MQFERQTETKQPLIDLVGGSQRRGEVSSGSLELWRGWFGARGWQCCVRLRLRIT